MWIYALLIAICTAATAASIISVYRATGRDRRLTAPSTARTPISVLKPLCGADDDLEANLETFFRQDYADFELVFGVQDPDDPALAVVRRLRKRFPSVSARLVIAEGKRALNPKVSNLRAMLTAGAHDVVVISDSNIAVAPDYLRLLLGELQADPKVGLVTNLFAGVGEDSLGATLDNLHLAGPVAGSIAASFQLSDQPVSVGKSMMFRCSVFESLGGLDSVGCFLAEDYVIGRMFSAAGYQVRLSGAVIGNVCRHATVGRFLHRHLRWGLIRSRVTPLLYPLEPLANPIFVALLAPLFGTYGVVAALWGIGLTLLRDAAQWLRLRGSAGLLAALPLGPVKELLTLGVWAVAPFIRHVSWRGHTYRVSSGTRLYAEAPMAEPGQLHLD